VVPYHWSKARRRFLRVHVWGFRALLALFTLLTLVGVVLAVAHGRWGHAARLVGLSIPVFVVFGFLAWLGARQLDGPVWGKDLPDDSSAEQRFEAWRSSRESRVTMILMLTFSAASILFGAVIRNWGILVLAVLCLAGSIRPTLVVFGKLQPTRLGRWSRW
jgi:hypothetical protein